ncbi:MAG: NDP-sugar synthase [Planctomycetes bacterium]|nr:NDP-sugar synthase [Planctomycetota bacterium]
MQISYYEDIMPRGPAGCVVDAARVSRADVFLILDASIMPQSVPIEELISVHANSGAAMTIVANNVGDSPAHRSGMNAVGIYVCDRRVLQFIPASGYQDIKEMLIPRLYEAGEVVAVFETDACVPRVKGAGSYLGANQLAISRLIETDETPVCHERHGTAIVHDTADIEAGARICGPVLIGERSSVSKNAVIVGPVSIGANCRVGEGSHVCRSILWDQVSVGSGAFVDQSILMHSAGVAAEAQVTRRIQHRTRLARALRG